MLRKHFVLSLWQKRASNQIPFCLAEHHMILISIPSGTGGKKWVHSITYSFMQDTDRQRKRCGVLDPPIVCWKIVRLAHLWYFFIVALFTFSTNVNSNEISWTCRWHWERSLPEAQLSATWYTAAWLWQYYEKLECRRFYKKCVQRRNRKNFEFERGVLLFGP